MTIHQAKNREFQVVIVLGGGSSGRRCPLARRWLYNAITRAKRRAIVIVQDPKKKRLSAPPFAYPSAVAGPRPTAAAARAAPRLQG